MKKWKRMIAFVLTVCMVFSLLPPVQIAYAAETIQRYELDTDGIDVGATYLIVNAGTAGSGNALRFYYSSMWSRDLRNQTLTIQKEDKENGITYIETGFTNEADCQFQFSSATAGVVKHDDSTLELSASRYQKLGSQTLTFTHLGGGQYRIHCTSNSRTYYLRYSNNDWTGSTDSNPVPSVYLYKLVEHVVSYDVTYNGNGHTSGTLPENAVGLESGREYTVPAPADLRKDVGEDTWLFACWNTKPDGSGTEYAPGDTITVTEDITLYAEWYQQTKYSVSMLTYLDDVPADVETTEFFALLKDGGGTYIPLTRRSAGVYSAKVVDNGTYVIYTKTAGNQDEPVYEPVHGHTVVIYDQDGTTECKHYSVTYNTAGGNWAEGEEPTQEIHLFGEAVTAYDKIPTLEGNRFLGWKDQNGNLYAPGQLITNSMDKTVNLTAQWEELIDVTVTVTIDHQATSGGADNDDTKSNVTITLMREDLSVEERTLTKDSEGYAYNEENNTTTYTVTFAGMPKGIYHVASAKSGYEIINNTSQSDENRNQNINLGLQYMPTNFDLMFDVVVNAENKTEKSLMPKAVNVKVSYWGYNEERVLGWHIITQQAGTTAPTTVTLDANGMGSGFFPVWQYWSGSTNAYEYRVEVTSFILPDGTVVPAATDDQITYKIEDTGLYNAVVSIAGKGRVPTYPDGSNTATNLTGAYYDGSKQDGQQQVGKPTVTVDITPYTVTFDAGAGTVNGESTITLTGQYRYPSLADYVAVPNNDDKRFIGWMVNGELATDMAGQLLDDNVTYVARYNENLILSGTVTAAATYPQKDENGEEQTVYIHEIDHAKKVYVVLQKKVGDVYNDINSVPVELTYEKDENNNYIDGVGHYEFKDLPNDGTEYRVQLLVRNYTGSYDNNSDEYTEAENVAVIDVVNAKAQVDIKLDFAPDQYQQAIRVDASRIHEDLRPTGVLTQILYRDLGDVHNYKVISQHTVAPNGVMVELDSANATGLGFDDVWNWHPNGSLYEYQAQVFKVYGKNVPGAYSEEGLAYTENSPYTVVYGRPNNYLQQELEHGVMLEAKLVPKQYPVHLDLHLGDDTTTPVVGMEEFMVDDDSGVEKYMFLHTWSYAEQFTAYPYREGYVFKGWTIGDTGGVGTDEDDVYIRESGVVNVGNTLAKEVTLVAQWDKLEGTDYTVRHLELNTDKVLKGASKVKGATAGSTVAAVDFTNTPIEGYVYAGALVNGTYVDKTDNPTMTVTNDPLQNVMIIYYLPDGSDGYTEQVESNLEINKTAVLEDDGTYTITLDTWTKDNPITTLIQQNTPLDIVLVLDQSGSLAENNYEYLTALQDAVGNFVESVADHGRRNEVDHRIAMVGYAGNASDGHSSDPVKATGGKTTNSWINTGVFDSNGEFHLYNVNGFNYAELENPKTIKADGQYYTKVTVDGKDKYLLLTHHNEYRHLISEEEARVAVLQGETVFGYVYNEQNVGGFVELTRNSSGLWLYGNKKLYSATEFFTYHTDVWTHRDGVQPRQIHAYGVGAAYAPVDGHEGVYTRTETTGNYEQDIYVDALVPVSLGYGGSGGTNPGLLTAIEGFGADGATRASYGMEMANEILKSNPAEEGRIRMVVMFTDGEPGYMGFDASSGQSYYDQAVTEANNAIAEAYISKNTYGAYVYSIGLYKSAGVDATSEVAYYMNALSSNYPDAQKMDDIKAAVTYTPAANGTRLEDNGKFFVQYNGTYYEVKYGYVRVSGNYWSQYCWYYTRNNANYSISTTEKATVSGGKVGNFTIYQATGGYAATDHSGYYSTTESAEHLEQYFEKVLQDITTKITTEIILHEDTILRDIMGQGLVLTPGTVVTAYAVPGEMKEDGEVEWAALDPNDHKVASVEIPDTIPNGGVVASTQKAEITSTNEDGTTVTKQVPYIQVYNLNSANPTNPQDTKVAYHPHTVDITGYDFEHWYISQEKEKLTGYKMVVTITRVEARDDVEWGKSTATNNEQSGLWLPADAQGKRELLLPFDQPTTIFVERAYVLDYGKTFTLSGWYFDDEGEKKANPVHVDCDITNGMNYFNVANTQNSVDGTYGNTKYGNVQVVELADKSNAITYTPTTTNWDGCDQFYVFGDTWRKTVLAQDANENGNLWNKVTVIPANNVYYEDSFITATSNTNQNGIEGFTFTGDWSVVSGEGAVGQNTEVPEKHESAPYGDVHGWTDSLGDDKAFTDGSAHATGLNEEIGAQAELTFTGTGVEVYTRTNAKSGMVVAALSRITKGENGENITAYKTIAVDNLAVSGDYYHIPTVAFKELPYGTYKLQLIATAADVAVDGVRYEYYIDGVRIHNPLGNTGSTYQSDIVKDAYGLETNAVFTEIRDVLLDYGDFNVDMDDDNLGKMGAVFIDWIGTEESGIGQPTYNVGTFETYGPKNEVYLTEGQAIVLKVAEGNTYYVGLKSLTGGAVTANVSGIDQADPTAITFDHTTDMYYQVTPVGGYIVIQNGSAAGSGAILSITNLRTTNLTAPAANGGILGLKAAEAEEVVNEFADYMENKPVEEPQPEEEKLPSAEEQALANDMQAMALFADVRQWLATE